MAATLSRKIRQEARGVVAISKANLIVRVDGRAVHKSAVIPRDVKTPARNHWSLRRIEGILVSHRRPNVSTSGRVALSRRTPCVEE